MTCIMGEFFFALVMFADESLGSAAVGFVSKGLVLVSWLRI